MTPEREAARRAKALRCVAGAFEALLAVPESAAPDTMYRGAALRAGEAADVAREGGALPAELRPKLRAVAREAAARRRTNALEFLRDAIRFLQFEDPGARDAMAAASELWKGAHVRRRDAMLRLALAREVAALAERGDDPGFRAHASKRRAFAERDAVEAVGRTAEVAFSALDATVAAEAALRPDLAEGTSDASLGRAARTARFAADLGRAAALASRCGAEGPVAAEALRVAKEEAAARELERGEVLS